MSSLGHRAVAPEQAACRIGEHLAGGDGPVLLFGAPGTGKSFTAAACARALACRGSVHCLAADPGSPAFGVPGAVNLGRWRETGWEPEDLEALCSLDAGRFRLPLMLALSRLLSRTAAGMLMVDSPGVVRSVAGAELLQSLLDILHPGLVAVFVPRSGPPPLRGELAASGIPVLTVLASADARRPARLQRARARTALWDGWLDGAREWTLPAGLPVLGTPPPAAAPEAWAGRQAAVTDGTRTLTLGEVVAREDTGVRLRSPPCAGRPVALIVRDAVRDADGLLGTAPPFAAEALPRTPPPDVRPYSGGGSAGAPVPVVRVGSAFATLINGVLGDPLLHLRLRHRRRSLLFDLGDAARLPARIAHQVTDVFVSHAHIDHFGGFLWLLRSRIGESGVCRLHGPPGLAGHAEGMIRGVLWDRIGDRGPVFEVAELHGDRLRRYRLQAGAGGALPLPEAEAGGGTLLGEVGIRVRALPLDHHGTPVLAYAFEQPRRIRIRKERLAERGWAPGPWLAELKRALLSDEPGTVLALPDGGRTTAGELAPVLTLTAPGTRLVYATDLADTPGNRARLVPFARGADAFFCEAPFLEEHRDQAARTGHLTARACGEIAAAAGVGQLVPFHFSRRYEGRPGQVYGEVTAVFDRVTVPPEHGRQA